MENKTVPQFLLLPIDQIELLEYNPRSISLIEMEKLCADIESDKNFLMQRPPLINHITESNRYIAYAGNQRLKAAKKLGITDIYVWVEQNVPEEVQNERMLKDNLHRGEWDIDLLKKYDTSFLLNIGFKKNELTGLFTGLLTIKEDDFNVDEEVKKIETPISQEGDLYLLGEHRLLCGNSERAEDVDRVMAGDISGMLYCDPPYNIGLSYDKGIKGNSNKKSYTDKKFNDNKKPEDYIEWLNLIITNGLSVSNGNAHVFFWCDPKFIGQIQDAYKLSKVKCKSVCFWIKNQFNPVIQMAFNRVIEPCVYGTIGKPFLNKESQNLSEILNKEIGKDIHGDITHITDMWLARRDKVNDYVHPTQKPITLHEKPLKRCTEIGSVVVDLFGGSGSTLIACEQMKRKARLIEQDPVFVDVIVKRWEKFTGQKAIRYAAKKTETTNETSS